MVKLLSHKQLVVADRVRARIRRDDKSDKARGRQGAEGQGHGTIGQGPGA